MSPRTERAYVGWIRCYVSYHRLRRPGEIGQREVVEFLTDLAAEQRVARSTQVQAMSALIILYRDVLRKPLGDVRTTMIYTHVLNRGGLGVRSPADRLGF
jgi:hypothetical protein